MRRRGEVVAGIAIAATVLGSWSYSLVYDALEVSRESYQAGQDWARTHQATVEQCNERPLWLPGYGLNRIAWKQGCLDAIGFSW